MATVLNIGADTRVNTYAQNSQFAGSVTALSDGGYVVVWDGPLSSGTGGGIFAQRYDAAGHRVGGETQINTTTTNVQEVPKVAGLSDGGYVITWDGAGTGDSQGVFAQRFAFNGVAIGGNVLVNTTVASSQILSSVAALSDGGCIITWASSGQDGSGYGIYSQRYDAGGARVGGETLVNTTTAGTQYAAQVTGLADGGYVITWEGYDGTGDSIFAQRYNEAGVMVGGETLVADFTPYDALTPAITSLSDGGYIIAWESYDGSGDGIFAQRYDASGAPVGGTTQINAVSTYDQENVAITGLSDGGYMVTWDDDSRDVFTNDVSGKRFDADGNAIGGEILLNTYTTDNQSGASLAGLADGGFVAAWTSAGQDGSGFGVYDKLFSAAASLSGNQTVYGTSGSDAMDGGSGADTMYGGRGDDVYVIDNAGDKVFENPDEGQDTVQSSITFTIGANVENLTLTGATAINGTGNALDNIIIGNAGNNVLKGGAGADTFVFGKFGAANGLDHLNDFVTAVDHLSFTGAGYGIAAGHVLGAAELSLTGVATSAAGVGQFVYNSTTHTLSWDSNGVAAGGMTDIVVFDNGATPHTGDFLFT